MKRRLLIVSLFLLTGAVVNVAVAWGCAVWTDPTQAANPRHGLRITQTELWAATRYERAGFTCVESLRVRPSPEPARSPGSLPTKQQTHPRDLLPLWAVDIPVSESWGTDTRAQSRIVIGSGWPSRSMWQDPLRTIDDGTGARVLLGQGGNISTPFPSWQGVFPRTLPLRPIWPGFAVNTLFYATVLWLVTCGPFVLRRFIRIRRGLCPKCAYPMGGSDVCTECGKPLPYHAKVAT